ncbi:MAG: hypothetical protein ACFB15_18585 [Cyclobacteriaceae bacterium]
MKWYIMMIFLTFILSSCQTDSSGTHPSGTHPSGNQLDKSLEEYKKKLERSIKEGDELVLPSSIFPEPTVSFGSPSRFKGIIFIAEDGYYQGKMGQLAFSTKLDAIKESLMKYRNEKQIEGTIWVKIEIDKNSSKSDLIDLLVMFKSIEVSPISI